MAQSESCKVKHSDSCGTGKSRILVKCGALYRDKRALEPFGCHGSFPNADDIIKISKMIEAAVGAPFVEEMQVHEVDQFLKNFNIILLTSATLEVPTED